MLRLRAMLDGLLCTLIAIALGVVGLMIAGAINAALWVLGRDVAKMLGWL